MRCPFHYCCTNMSSTGLDLGCSLRGYVCSGNRKGVLCGSCRDGYSQTIDSSSCRANSDCTGVDALWFLPLYAAVLYLYARYLISKFCRVEQSLMRSIFYFYQMAGLLLSSGADNVQLVTKGVLGVFNMQFHTVGMDGLVCLWPDMSTPVQVALQSLAPFAAAAFVLLHFILSA